MADRSAAGEGAAPPSRDGDRTGVRRFLILAAGLGALTASTYLVPSLERWRPWLPGDPVPFARVLQFRPPQDRAGIGGATGRVREPRDRADLLASAPLPEPASEASPNGSAASPQERPAGPVPPRIPPTAYEGLPREIEDPDGAMLPLYRRLRDAALGRPGTLARLSLWSVSTNGSDRVTSTLRRALQERFGDGGKGFVPISPGWGAQEHQDVAWSARGFSTMVVNLGTDPLGRYGLGGVDSSPRRAGARATFGTSGGPAANGFASARLLYQGFPEGGTVELGLEDGTAVRVESAAAEPVDRVHEIRAPDGPHTLTVRAVAGDARLYGVVMEREGPGVVVDGLMMLGASVGMMPNYDAEHLASQIQQREPDLLVFWLGGNDVRARAFTREWFVDNYGSFIAGARAGRPEAGCLVVTTLDKGHRQGGRIVSRRRVRQVVEAQRATAGEQGCAVFDLFEATGGTGTMRRWYEARPRLVGSDLGHLTGAGARLVGTLLERAILKGYDDSLATGAH